jgi:hypothetical protein
MADAAEGVAVVAIAHLVRKPGPGKGVHLEHVMQELHQLVGS